MEEDILFEKKGNTKKRKSNTSSRSSKRKQHKSKEPVNVFADLQIPSVSNNGCTMSSLHYYNKSYHSKPYSTLDSHHQNNSYERNRKISYDVNAYDKKLLQDNIPYDRKQSYDKSMYDKKLFQNSYDKKSYPTAFDSRLQSYDPLRSSNHSYESNSNRGSKPFSSTSNLIDTTSYFQNKNQNASQNISRFSHYDNVKNLRASSNNYQPRSFDKAEL
ncbi:hypothetical protein M8J76_012227 [Diaphorina citri]|nr:hypothetical protein M8J75_001621 [Diaphorina citri]KAI5737315.1 hypothetical protein M8J76_012227 [Diaphorina citri]